MKVKRSKNKVGEVNVNRYGSKMEIIIYRKWDDIDVKFENGYIVRNTNYNQFLSGMIKNVYDRSIYNIGFLGEGKYPVKINGILTQQYRTWQSMIDRCYNEKFHERQPTYIECSVCSTWHNFQTYAKWHDANYYEIDNEKMSLDKDILVKNNKIYSPDNCVFVPASINNFFVNTRKPGKYLPGVNYMEHRMKTKYAAQISELGKRKTIGYYETEVKAFLAYKHYRENIAKRLAVIYKGKIPNSVHERLINYELEHPLNNYWRVY